jgi:hypothetical protein
MPDEVIAIKGVKKDYSAHTQKIAVLWPVVGRRSLKDDEVVADLHKLRRRWHKRIEQLKLGGWADLLNPGVSQFARNCPPSDLVFSTASKTLRPCKLCLCPSCHMRMTAKVYNTISRCLPDRGRLTTKPLKFVEVSGRMVLRKPDVGKFVSSPLHEWMEAPKRLLKRLKPLGAFRLVTLDPKHVGGQISGYRFTYRILAVMPDGWEMPPWLDNGRRKVRVTDVKSKKQLINLVARTCRYPVGLLRGDLRMTVIALNARRRKRLSEFTGCFRSANGGSDV